MIPSYEVSRKVLQKCNTVKRTAIITEIRTWLLYLTCLESFSVACYTSTAVTFISSMIQYNTNYACLTVYMDGQCPMKINFCRTAIQIPLELDIVRQPFAALCSHLTIRQHIWTVWLVKTYEQQRTRRFLERRQRRFPSSTRINKRNKTLKNNDSNESISVLLQFILLLTVRGF